MWKRICSCLAKRFDAHLDERQKETKVAVDRFRRAMAEFEEARKAVIKYDSDVDLYMRYRERSKNEGITLRYFSLSSLDAEFKTQKAI